MYDHGVTSIRRVLSVLFGVSGKNIPDYFKRKLASCSRKGNVNEVAIILSEVQVKYFLFLVYSKIKGRVELSSGSTLFWRLEHKLILSMLSLSRLDYMFLVHTIV